MNDIELVPVRYGKWIFSGMFHHVCSVCEQISGGKYNYEVAMAIGVDVVEVEVE